MSQWISVKDRLPETAMSAPAIEMHPVQEITRECQEALPSSEDLDRVAEEQQVRERTL